MNYNPIICAIDTNDIQVAQALISQVQSHIGMIKLGLEFFLYNGMNGVKILDKYGIPIFLDLKLHDIPNTVAKSIKSLINDINITMTTIHILGGPKMLDIALNTLQQSKKKINLIGVTILTSLDDNDLQQMGLQNVTTAVSNLCHIAQDANLDGIVCSALDLDFSTVQKLPQKMLKIVPGIITDISQKDQKRVLTPNKTLSKGATYIVVGRAITNNNNPAVAAKKILDDIKNCIFN